MHSPRVAVARAALQRLYDYYLRPICRLLPSTPRRLLLTELGLLPLQVFARDITTMLHPKGVVNISKILLVLHGH